MSTRKSRYGKALYSLSLLLLATPLFGCVTGAEYTRMQQALGMEIIELRQGSDKSRNLLKEQDAFVQQAKANLDAERRKTAEIKAQLDAERQKQQALEARIKELEARSGSSREEIAKCSEMLKGGSKKVFELQTELNKKEEELKKKENELNARIAELEKTKKTSDELSSKLAAREAELAKQTKDLQEKEEKLKSSLERTRLLESRIEALRKVYADLREKLKGLIQTGKLRIEMIDGMLVLQMPEKILFPTGSSTLKRDGTQTIQGVADILKSMSYRWQVSGHTDSTGSDWGNWQLSTRRALAVLRVLLKAGMAPTQISISGFGQHQPSASNDTPENRALNRRTEIVLIPNLSEIFGSVIKAKDPAAPAPRE
jgi:chemotaxis protein MotB